METRTLELRRQVQRARYRHAWWMALCAGVAANALLALALWVTAPRAAPPVTRVVAAEPAPAPPPVVIMPAVSPPVIVVVPGAPAPAPAAPALTVPFGDLGPCPAPHRQAPRGALRQPPDVYDAKGLATSPTDSRLVAVWTDGEIQVSRDGGRSWQQVLDGEARVMDVSFDCHGRVLALRAEVGLGIREGGRETWRPLVGLGWGPRYEAEPEYEVDDDDTRYEPRLIGGGRLIAVVGAPSSVNSGATVAFTADAGTSWWHTDLGYYEGATPHTAWRGDELHVVMPWTDCMSEGVRRVVIGEHGTEAGELDVYMQGVAIDGGVVHAVGWSCPDPHDDVGDAERPPSLCTWRAGSGWRATSLAGRLPTETDAVLFDGPVDVVLLGDSVAAVRNGRVGASRPWPADVVPRATDLAGRVWAIDNGEIVRR